MCIYTHTHLHIRVLKTFYTYTKINICIYIFAYTVHVNVQATQPWTMTFTLWEASVQQPVLAEMIFLSSGCARLRDSVVHRYGLLRNYTHLDTLVHFSDMHMCVCMYTSVCVYVSLFSICIRKHIWICVHTYT